MAAKTESSRGSLVSPSCLWVFIFVSVYADLIRDYNSYKAVLGAIRLGPFTILIFLQTKKDMKTCDTIINKMKE